MRKGISTDQALVRRLLDAAEVLHLSFTDAQGPYAIPVNFARDLTSATARVHK